MVRADTVMINCVLFTNARRVKEARLPWMPRNALKLGLGAFVAGPTTAKFCPCI